MPRKTKRLYIDIESTGPEKLIHGIHEIAGIIDIDGQIEGVFEFKCRPFIHRAIEQEALDVCGVTEKEILKYPAPELVFKKLLKVLEEADEKYHPGKKFTICAYSAHFDVDFLAKFFLHNDSNRFGMLQDWRFVDVLQLVRILVDLGDKDLGRLTNHRLTTICMFFDVPIIPHNALEDAVALRKIHRKLTNRLITKIRGK